MWAQAMDESETNMPDRQCSRPVGRANLGGMAQKCSGRRQCCPRPPTRLQGICAWQLRRSQSVAAQLHPLHGNTVCQTGPVWTRRVRRKKANVADANAPTDSWMEPWTIWAVLFAPSVISDESALPVPVPFFKSPVDDDEHTVGQEQARSRGRGRACLVPADRLRLTRDSWFDWSF